MKRYIVVPLVLLSFMSMAGAEEGFINKKALSEIDDIVMEVTGTHTITKKSFLKFRNDANGSFRFIINWSDANLDGSDVKLNESKSYETGHAAGKTNTGIHPVVGKKRTNDGKLVVVFPSTVSSGTEKLFINSLKISGNADDHSITNDAYHYHSATGKLNNLYISDSASGLFPENNGDREVFAITYFIANGGKRPGFSQSFNSHLCLFDPETNQSKVHDLGVMNGYFPSVRVVAGDFDNDGKENELAVIRDGKEANYYMTVYRVSGLDIGNAIYSKSLGARENTEADNSDGCDIVAGDFNNDGKTEIAAVYADFKDGDYYPTVTTFSWNGSTFKQQSKTDKNDDLHLGSTHWYSSSYVPHFGLIAEVEDIDGNGTDDIVLLTASYGSSEGNIVASVWDTDKNLNPSMKCHKKTSTKIAGWGGTMGEDMSECSYLPRSVSLGLVPLGDKSNGANVCRIIVTKSQGGDSVKYSSDYRTGDEIFYMTVTNSNGSVTLSDLTLWKSGSSGYATAIVPGDFYTECVELGDNPEHLVYEGDRVYAAEVQAPPYHVDFIQPDFPIGKSAPTSKNVVNVSFSGSYSQYQQTQSTTTGNDVSFNTTSSTEWGVDAKVGGSYKLFGVETSGGYKDMATTVENEANSARATRSLTISQTTNGSDNVVLYKTNRHVWRYQILSYISKPNDEVGDDKFMTFTLCEAPEIHDGDAGNSSQLDDYNPIHEEGNLFSYPALIEHIPYYLDGKQAELSPKQTTTMGYAKSSLTVELSKVNTNNTTTTTKSKKALNGSLTLSLNVPKYLHASTTATGSYSKELTNTEAYTKTYQTSDKFIIELPASNTGIMSDYTAHSITTQVYADAAGVMKVAFAVPELNSSAALWNRYGGVYGKKPDPALVLPKRFGIFKDAEGLQKWGAVEHWPTALKLRGISFYDVTAESSTIFSDYDESSGLRRNLLIAGHSYKIQIPVYNASFVDAGNVDVEMRLYKMKGNVDDNVLPSVSSLDVIDRKTVKLEGWVDGSDVNKAMVSFDWTIGSTYTENNYRLFFVIDPDNKVDEIHEVWDISKEGEQYTGDPGGNNMGYANIAILNSEPEVVNASSELFHAAADDVTEDDFKMYFEPVRANDTRTRLTLNEFRAELANMSEDFVAHATVVYSGARTLTNVSFTMTRNRDGELSIIADRNIPAIFPNREYHCSFIVYPERLLSSTFDVSMTGDNLNLSWSKDDGNDGGTDDNSTPSDPAQGVGSSGSGCDMGTNALIALSLLTLYSLKMKKHR